ncbi:MAG: hypothetical protein ACJ8C4_01170 [Gemmataceae bacterium]
MSRERVRWDVKQLRFDSADDLTEGMCQQVWSDLSGDAASAFIAVGKGVKAPATMIGVLKKNLRPRQKIDPTRIRQLTTALDDQSSEVRYKAENELRQLGPGVVAPLHQFLAGDVSPEVRRRVETVIKSFHNEDVHADRALEIIEAIATPQAKVLIEEIARGDAAETVTQCAQAGLMRLQARK